jgi:hypothetical protein
MALTTTRQEGAIQTASSLNTQALGRVIRQLSLAGNSSFPLSDDVIIAYIEKVQELAPDITPTLLQKLVNKMITGELLYDANKGLRNIFDAFAEHKRTRNRYILQNETTGEMIDITEDDDATHFDPAEWVIVRARAVTVFDMSKYQHPRFRNATYQIGEAVQAFATYCKTNRLEFKDFIDFI